MPDTSPVKHLKPFIAKKLVLNVTALIVSGGAKETGTKETDTTIKNGNIKTFAISKDVDDAKEVNVVKDSDTKVGSTLKRLEEVEVTQTRYTDFIIDLEKNLNLVMKWSSGFSKTNIHSHQWAKVEAPQWWM
ncbi:hypothetical protein B0O99DRAFT_685792 [Bisporella sp. PMI_857]|nr:hypothetical protein B0O99DRAFT_685792 [Bisporella sp. PMI_857]